MLIFFNCQRKFFENGTFKAGKRYIQDGVLAPNTEVVDDFNSIR